MVAQKTMRTIPTSDIADRLRAARLACDCTYRGSERFELKRRVWNGTADRHPIAIVHPTTSAEVSRIVRIAAECGALLAVRGGGHSLPGHSTCDDGIVLDLSAMNDISVDPSARSCTVGGGALLGDVDRATLRYGFIVPAGVVSHTGVGGLTLGGGMGWLSRRYGLTMDCLTAVDLITADGSRLHVSADSEPDLFWALRGGGGNFGVASAFRFRLHELGPVSAGTWAYPLNQVHDVLAQVATLAERAPRELTLSMRLTRDRLSVTAFWSGTMASEAAMLSPFRQLSGPGSGTYSRVDFVDHQSRSDDHFRWGRRYYAKGGFLDSLERKAVDSMAVAASAAPTADSEIYLLQLGGAISETADNATAYSGRAASFYWIVEPIWDEPTDDASCLAWGRATAAQLTPLSIEANYVNEQADSGADIAAQAYGQQKYARLRRIKARYDASNLFHLNQNIEPGSA